MTLVDVFSTLFGIVLSLSILVCLAILLPCGWFLVVQYLRIQLAAIPPDLPWVGLHETEILPKLRAALREISAKRGPIEEGYEKFSKHGKAFILPTLHWPEVVLPPTLTRWVAAQPDSILSTPAVQDELTGPEYFAHGPDSAACHDFSVITRDLTRNIGRVTPGMVEEIVRGCREELSIDTGEWREIELTKAIQEVTAKVASRVIVGNKLCHNEDFHSKMHDWEMCTGYCGLIFRFMPPKWAKPIFGRLLALPLNFLKWRIGRIVLPEIQQRQQAATHGKTRKDDLLQWVVESAERSHDARARSPQNILGRVVLYNMFAQHTTQITTATVLFDMISYPSGQQVLDEVRQEAALMLSEISTDPYSTRQSTRLDSVIRESMRLNPMFGRGITKEVVQPGGIITPDGLFLPQGCHVSTASTSCTQRDSNFYENGESFVPLRFHRRKGEDGEDPRDKQSATSVGERYLTFSLGKHACPGRFFAVQLMKLLLGYILVNYEFEQLKERPDFITFGDLSMPPPTKVRVRQRWTNERNAAGMDRKTGNGES